MKAQRTNTSILTSDRCEFTVSKVKLVALVTAPNTIMYSRILQLQSRVKEDQTPGHPSYEPLAINAYKSKSICLKLTSVVILRTVHL